MSSLPYETRVSIIWQCLKVGADKVLSTIKRRYLFCASAQIPTRSALFCRFTLPFSTVFKTTNEKRGSWNKTTFANFQPGSVWKKQNSTFDIGPSLALKSRRRNHGQLIMSLSSFKTLVLTLSLVTFRSGQLQCPKRTVITSLAHFAIPLLMCCSLGRRRRPRSVVSVSRGILCCNVIKVAGRRLYANWSFFKIPGDETGLRRLVPPSWLGVVTTHYAGIKSVCSGALINDRYVLTAQRCVLP